MHILTHHPPVSITLLIKNTFIDEVHGQVFEMFQFHKVQLTLQDTLFMRYSNTFQFHKVQLTQNMLRLCMNNTRFQFHKVQLTHRRSSRTLNIVHVSIP